MRAGVPVLLAATMLDACGGSAGSAEELGAAATGGASGGSAGGAGGTSSSSGGSVGLAASGGEAAGGSGGGAGTGTDDNPWGPESEPIPDSEPPPGDYGFSETADYVDPYCEFYVEVPEAGTPALVEPICAEDLPPVASGWAARATLGNPHVESASGETMADGWVEIASELAAHIEGVPELTVIEVDDEYLRPTKLDNVRLEGGKYRFDATWDHALSRPQNDGTSMRLIVGVAFDMQCAGTLRRVESRTVLHLCLESGQINPPVTWVSSGDLCNVCAIIAEMAPSPIVPGQREDDMPLARALRLALKTVARIGRTLVLWAEHDGGSGDWDYDWTTTGGKLERVGDDLVAWTPPDGPEPHLLQVAMAGAQAAAVATLRSDERIQGAA